MPTVCRCYLPLRHPRMASARLVAGHGHLPTGKGVSSTRVTTTDRTGDPTMPPRPLATVWASSLSERQASSFLVVLCSLMERKGHRILRYDSPLRHEGDAHCSSTRCAPGLSGTRRGYGSAMRGGETRIEGSQVQHCHQSPGRDPKPCETPGLALRPCREMRPTASSPSDSLRPKGGRHRAYDRIIPLPHWRTGSRPGA